MGTTGNLKLPTHMSSCVRLFIESLFTDVGIEDGDFLRQTFEFKSQLLKVPEKDKQLTT